MFDKETDMERGEWRILRGDMPLITTSLHDGHDIKLGALPFLVVDEATRLREEDPYTGKLAEVSDTRVIVRQSRFKFDVNRPRDKAVYRSAEDAWGINVWNENVPETIFTEGLAFYDAFNQEVFALLDEWVERFGTVVVYDLHTYNHRRNGPDGEPADPDGNPEVNIGTGTLNRQRFGRIVERFMQELSDADYLGRHLDVQENVKFNGGDFSRRIHERYYDSVCVLAIEFKKIFMDEWTGEIDPEGLHALKRALASTIPGVLEECINLS